MRVLLVEDEPDLRKLLTSLLAEEGHDIGIASTYDIADAMLVESARWDALISNVRLPGAGDGLHLAAKAETLGIPALLVAGHPDDIVMLSAKGARHLRKPFDLQSLLDWLHERQRSGVSGA